MNTSAFDDFVESTAMSDGCETLRMLEGLSDRAKAADMLSLRYISELENSFLNPLKHAFNMLVVEYQATCPRDWRFVSSFDAFVHGYSCAGYERGDAIYPQDRFMIGGVDTLNELRRRLDKLVLFVDEQEV